MQLHSFLGHNDSVNVVAWSPSKPLQFASGSSDTRVVLWDI
jgi:WD40 repeat protein